MLLRSAAVTTEPTTATADDCDCCSAPLGPFRIPYYTEEGSQENSIIYCGEGDMGNTVPEYRSQED